MTTVKNTKIETMAKYSAERETKCNIVTTFSFSTSSSSVSTSTVSKTHKGGSIKDTGNTVEYKDLKTGKTSTIKNIIVYSADKMVKLDGVETAPNIYLM